MVAKALEISVSGGVQEVGYRRVVQEAARALNLTGFVKNRPDGTVRIFAQGERASLQEFLKAIEIRGPPIKVEKIESRATRSKSSCKFFRIKFASHAPEMMEAFDSANEQLALLTKELRDHNHEYRASKKRHDNFDQLGR